MWSILACFDFWKNNATFCVLKFLQPLSCSDQNVLDIWTRVFFGLCGSWTCDVDPLIVYIFCSIINVESFNKRINLYSILILKKKLINFLNITKSHNIFVFCFYFFIFFIVVGLNLIFYYFILTNNRWYLNCCDNLLCPYIPELKKKYTPHFYVVWFLFCIFILMLTCFSLHLNIYAI